MPSNTWEYFKMIIVIQLVFGVGATMIAHSLPEQTYLSISQQVTPEQIENISEISGNFTEKMETIRNPPIDLPFVDTAFVLFYTGNLVIDAFINSIFAIPSMATVLVKGFALFFPIDPAFETALTLFVYAFIAVLYIIGIIAVIMNLRSGGGISNVV